VFYRGSVQGVGFRYTASRYAGDMDLRGWIKNLSNGQVEMIVEGPEENIDQFLDFLDQTFSGYIIDKVISSEPARGEFLGFDIRR